MVQRSVPVSEIEGIGDVLAERLAETGVRHAEDLLATPLYQMADRLALVAGISESQASSSFIPQASLLLLDSMSGALANALVELGYSSYRALLDADVVVIRNQLGELADDGQLPSVPDEDSIRTLQIEAGRLAGSISIHVTVIDDTAGDPVENASVRINGTGFGEDSTPFVEQTDDRGTAFVFGLAPVAHTVVVTHPSFARGIIAAGAPPDGRASARVALSAGPDQPRVIDEFTGGYVLNSPYTASVLKPVELSDLPQAPPVMLAEMGPQRSRLDSLWRVQTGDVVEVPTITVDTSELPSGAAVGSVLEHDSQGTWQLIGVTVAEWREEFRNARLPEALNVLGR